jgi:tetratricopeptide (TPR) repeat protein
MLRGQYLATAQILIAQGNFDKARDRMNKANQLSANFLIALDEIEDSTHAFLLERTGSLQEAIQIYYRIATPMSRARLSIIFLDQGNTTAALDAARVALLDSPDEPTAHVVLGNILEKTNPGQALVEYEKALSYVTKGNLSMVPLKYLELPRAKAGIDRLSKLKGGGNL